MKTVVVIADIKFHCGCQFRTTNLKAACDHAESSDHTLTVTGLITPVETDKD